MKTTTAKVAGAFELGIDNVGQLVEITDRGRIAPSAGSALLLLFIRSQTTLVFQNLGLTTLSTSLFDSNTLLVHLDLSYNALVSLPASLFDYCVSLTDVALNNNALTAASVNSVLASLLVAGATGGTLLIDGGTNAAPTGQGLTDKTALVSAGWTITTN